MGKADRLSKRLDWKVGTEKDNWLHKLEKVIIEGLEVEVIEKIKKARGKDEEVVRIVKKMKKAGIKVI